MDITLGYIYSSRRINNIPSFIKVSNDINFIKSENKPYLIVGLNNAKQRIDDFSILDKSRKGNMFWTFGKTEKRDEYEKDIDFFIKYCIDVSVSSIKYYYINPLILHYNKCKKLIEILSSNERKYIYISGGMIYVYYSSYVLGISIDILDYCGIHTRNIIKKFQENCNNVIFYNDSFLDKKLKASIKNKKYVTAYFMSMETKQNE